MKTSAQINSIKVASVVMFSSEFLRKASLITLLNVFGHDLLTDDYLNTGKKLSA